MSLSKHPNVLRVRGSWLDGHKLHIALRLMNAGSAADVMQYAWPGGMEEEVVRCILRQALEGLKQVLPLPPLNLLNSFRSYLHINGFIHRDIKAANLLIDDDGTVLLGDLGVAAPLTDEDHTHTHVNDKASRAVIFDPDVSSPPRRSRVGKRRSFVGTVRSFPLSQDLIVLNSISHVGWLQNLFPASITTRAPIFGPSVSRPSSWLRGVLPGHESPLVQSFLRCESPAISPGNISSLKLNLITVCRQRGSRATNPRSSRRRAQVLSCFQGNRGALPREGPLSPVHTIQASPCLSADIVLHRPTAAQLLQTPFFKNTKKPGYLVGSILRMQLFSLSPAPNSWLQVIYPH